jgi:hypothetical protein
VPIGRLDAGYRRGAGQCQHLRAENHLGAHGPVGFEKEARDFRRDDTTHQAVGRLQHRHRDAALAGRGRNLQPDEAATDHHEPLGGMQRLAKPFGILGTTQEMHPGKIRTGQRQNSVARAERQHEMIERQHRAGGQRHRAGRPVDRRHGIGELQIDPVLLEKAFGPELQPVEAEIFLQIGLRQRRPLVGQPVLLGGNRHAALEAGEPKAVRHLEPRLPAAGDHHAAHAPTSSRRNGTVGGRRRQWHACIIGQGFRAERQSDLSRSPPPIQPPATALGGCRKPVRIGRNPAAALEREVLNLICFT